MKEQITPIYEDKNFLAVYKPAGVLVHATYSMKHEAKNNKKNATCYMLHASGTLVDWLIKKYPEIKKVGDDPKIRPGIVHRLDKDTSGVILVARNQKYFEYLKNLFRTRQIKKTYLALVYGELEPKVGVIKKPIRLKPGTIKRTVWRGKMEKEAITEYKVLKYFIKTRINTDMNTDKYGCNISINPCSNPYKSATFSLLKVMPKTGRTHQIRVHLSSIGHPIVGDSLYGPKTNPLGLERLFLHAESLEFSTANGKRIKIEAGLPKELQNIIS
jgi:23S rRNA pseudouridine1911/1915/1917 synthase